MFGNYVEYGMYIGGKTGQVGDVKPLLVNEGQGNNVINRIVD